MSTHFHPCFGTPTFFSLKSTSFADLEPLITAGEWLRGGGPVGAWCLGARWRNGDVSREKVDFYLEKTGENWR